MAAGDVDAASMVDANHLLFLREGTLPPHSTRVITQTAPYDHCNFTTATTESSVVMERFAALLLGMSYGDPEVRRLFDLEGLKEWREGRTIGYSALERAVDENGFYDSAGAITADNYRY
jgi:ABC-type phosphate/phosphonate transport system substrate-binding protein